MPNWCDSELTIEGPDVERVLAAIRSEEDTTDIADHPLHIVRELDFNQIVPMPEDLKSPHGTISDLADLALHGGLGQYAEYPWVREKGITTIEQLCDHYNHPFEEMRELGLKRARAKEKYGFADWHGWSIANWGTKWNASGAVIEERSPHYAKLTFETAWTPCTPVIEALGDRFRDHRFTLTYFERGAGFQGRFVIAAGVVVEDESQNYEGTRGG